MQKCDFWVEGKPQGKGRARITKWGAYTPQKTVDYENDIRASFIDQCPKFHISDKPLNIKIEAYFKVPDSFSKNKKKLVEDGCILPTKKPDIDNIAKVVLDALNKVAYYDDTQVIQLTVEKKYYNTDGLIVIIKEI